MTQEALKLALDGITKVPTLTHGLMVKLVDVEAAIKEAFAQPEQEPVAWRAPNWSNLHGKYGYRDFDDPVTDINGKPSPYNEPLYTHPQRTWEGLSVFEINDLVESTEYEDYQDLVERTEAKLKEKNT